MAGLASEKAQKRAVSGCAPDLASRRYWALQELSKTLLDMGLCSSRVRLRVSRYEFNIHTQMRRSK